MNVLRFSWTVLFFFFYFSRNYLFKTTMNRPQQQHVSQARNTSKLPQATQPWTHSFLLKMWFFQDLGPENECNVQNVLMSARSSENKPHCGFWYLRMILLYLQKGGILFHSLPCFCSSPEWTNHTILIDVYYQILRTGPLKTGQNIYISFKTGNTGTLCQKLW